MEDDVSKLVTNPPSNLFKLERNSIKRSLNHKCVSTSLSGSDIGRVLSDRCLTIHGFSKVGSDESIRSKYEVIPVNEAYIESIVVSHKFTIAHIGEALNSWYRRVGWNSRESCIRVLVEVICCLPNILGVSR